MKNPFENLQHVIDLEEVCPVHDIPLKQLNKVVNIAGEKEPRKVTPFCPICVSEKKKELEQEKINDLLNATVYLKTYNVLERDSTIPSELKKATFSNFIANTAEEKQLLVFAESQAKKYLEGMKGNTLITGTTGVGKSHLSVAMAKAINEGYKVKNEPKSVLFISLTEIIKRIKEGWNYGKGASLTEFEAIELMKSADYLIIDDLGAKNAVIKPKSDWEQDLLFDVLNNRENTIFNTNLDSEELKTVYNERNYSRILKGLEGNSFKVFGITDKRYSVNNLKE